MRCIAGIETPDEGRIVVNDRVFFDSERKINLTPQQRRDGAAVPELYAVPESDGGRERGRGHRARGVEGRPRRAGGRRAQAFRAGRV